MVGTEKDGCYREEAGQGPRGARASAPQRAAHGSRERAPPGCGAGLTPRGLPAEGRPRVRHGAPPTEGPLTSRGLCHLGPMTPTPSVCASRGQPCGSGRDL